MIFGSPGMLHVPGGKYHMPKNNTEDYLTSKKADCIFCGAITGSLSLRKTTTK